MAQFTLPNGHNYFVDNAGRILILSCGIDGLTLPDPRTLTRTTGKVLPSSNSCIDDARWQYIKNTLAPSSDNWRLVVATTDSTTPLYGDGADGSRSRILPVSARNLNTMRNFNVRALPNSLTDWAFLPLGGSPAGALTFVWDEDFYNGGNGSDYSGIIWYSPDINPGSYIGLGLYSQSSNHIFEPGEYSFFYRNFEFWILPPGIPNFDLEGGSQGYRYQLDANGLGHNPGDPNSNHSYGWFVRSVGPVSNPVGSTTSTAPFDIQSGIRQLVLVWDGVVIFDSIVENSQIVLAPASGELSDFTSRIAVFGSTIIENSTYSYPANHYCGIVIGNYVYYPGATAQGSAYGWPTIGTGYYSGPPGGDYNTGFEIKRRRYFPSTPSYTGNKSNGQSSTTPVNATNIFFDVNGGRGGLGGTGYGNPGVGQSEHLGGYYAHGQRIIGYIEPKNETLTFTHYVGGNGGDVTYGYGAGPAGTGGVSGGGAGFGRSGSYTSGEYYGGGGGGGGASSGIYFNNYLTYINVSGGGGAGGGGSAYDSTTDARVNENFVFVPTTPTISSGGTSNTTPISNNGGGGGGGGGAPGGPGGASMPAGNSFSGGSGTGGSGYSDKDYVEYSYIVPDWLPTNAYYFGMGSNANRIFGTDSYYTSFVNTFGTSSTRNSNWNPNGSAELYYYTSNAQTYGQQVGVRLKIYDNGSWIGVNKIYVKESGVWKLVTDCYIKQNNQWKPFYY